MKKKTILAICIASVMGILLTGCCLSHDWQDATCTTPKTCAKCGEIKGEALGHDWQEATCTDAKTCSVCGETEGGALGHTWQEATCTDAKTCSVCGETEGGALGHTWQEATCTDAKTCSVCGETEGEALGHTWQDATCIAPRTCSACRATEGDIGDHTWKEATCLAPKTCTVCGETEGDITSHNYNENGICTMCGTSREIQLTRDNVDDFLTVTFEYQFVEDDYYENHGHATYIITVAPISEDYIFQDVEVCFGVIYVSSLTGETYDVLLENELSSKYIYYHDVDSEGKLVYTRDNYYTLKRKTINVYIADVKGTCIKK